MIDILLASYNGEGFISEQIESVLKQSFPDWRLIIQDDCSSDNTAEIAQKYADQYPDKITLYRRETPSGSARNNFFSMLPLAESEYIMFADQDDYWLEDKIKETYEKMRLLESESPDVPLLVHTDLTVADEKLNVISRSMFSYQGLDKRAAAFNRLLAQNNITGCTMMVNRRLLDLVKYHNKALMHDWWFGLIASSMGKIGFVDKPLILYRQHGGNELGAVDGHSAGRAVSAARDKSGSKKRVTLTYEQAAAFGEIYGGMLSDNSRMLLEKFSSIPQKNKAARICTILKYNFLKQSLITKIGQIILC